MQVRNRVELDAVTREIILHLTDSTEDMLQGRLQVRGRNLDEASWDDLDFDIFGPIEFVITVEEVFQIAISDDDAEGISTCGEMNKYLAGRLGFRDQTQFPGIIGWFRSLIRN